MSCVRAQTPHILWTGLLATYEYIDLTVYSVTSLYTRETIIYTMYLQHSKRPCFLKVNSQTCSKPQPFSSRSDIYPRHIQRHRKCLIWYSNTCLTRILETHCLGYKSFSPYLVAKFSPAKHRRIFHFQRRPTGLKLQSQRPI